MIDFASHFAFKRDGCRVHGGISSFTQQFKGVARHIEAAVSSCVPDNSHWFQI